MNITVKEYTLLFNAVTDAVEKLNSLRAELIIAQQQAKETVISREDSTMSK